MPDLYFIANNAPDAILDAEAFCLIASGSIRSEKRGHTCTTLQRAAKKKLVRTEQHRVRTIAGSALRLMVKVRVEYHGRQFVVLADIVTGSLYSLRTGQCYSGSPFIDD